MGSLEQIIQDPAKYEHTKQIIMAEVKKEQLQRKGTKKQGGETKIDNPIEKKVIGSKYRVILSNDELM